MNDVKFLVRTPGTLCQHCLDNNVHADADNTTVIAWCEHSRYGGMYSVTAGMWTLFGPFDTEANFRRAILFAASQHQATQKTQQHTPRQ